MTPSNTELAYQVLTVIDDAILENIGAEAARDEILALFQAREQKLLTEARLSERAWAYKNMRDHGTDPQWVEIAKLRMERLQNKTNDGGRDGGL